MGRVKGFHLKRIAKQLVEKYGKAFSIDFSANKKLLKSMGLKMESKMELNKLIGEVTIITKKKAAREKQDEAEQAPAAVQAAG